MFVFTLANDLYDAKKAQTKLVIDAGMEVIRYFHGLETSGAKIRAEAQDLAKRSLASSTFASTDYYWIIDIAGTMVMHPLTKELIEKNVLDTKDLNGNFPFRESIQRAKAGGGWVKYSWPKPGSPKSYPKLTYVSYFQPWDWVLGIGIYMDDVENEITSKTLHAIGIISIFFIAIIAATLYLSNRFMNQLRTLAIRDPLTGLFTRRYLEEVMPMLMSYHDRNMQMCLAAMFFDIDHFKKINDTHGHLCGDRVLIEFANSIRKTVRKGDPVIRYGGEEFLVITLCENDDYAIKMAERIRAAAHAIKHMYNDREFYATMSAGLAFREKGESFESLLDRSDAKMYEAKERGRDCLVY